MDLINKEWLVTLRFIIVFLYFILMGCALYPSLYCLVSFCFLLCCIFLWIKLCLFEHRYDLSHNFLNLMWILMILLNFFYQTVKTERLYKTILILLVIYTASTLIIEIMETVYKKKYTKDV